MSDRQEELTKSLVDLIDETISEIDELRKSRYEAAECDLHGPGDNLNSKAPGGADVDGSLGKEEDDDDEEEKDEAEKAANKEADPDGGFPHGVAKEEEAEKADDEEDDEEDDDDVEKAANKEADPNGGFPHGVAKADDEEEDEEEVEEEVEEAKKSEEDNTEELFKSYVDERVSPLEDKLMQIYELVEKMADQPVPSKRLSDTAVPLSKSGEEFESSLTKSEVSNKLFELKKSGKQVDDLDFTKIDLGADHMEIARKYGLN